MAIIRYIKKSERFAKRLIRWIPVLWEQEDWEYEHIYDVMQLKMEEILECIKRTSTHLDAKKTARQLAICLEYLKRMRHPDDYIEYPSNGLEYVKTSDNLLSIKISTHFNIQCKKCKEFEKFNEDMFWKRFLQWHKKSWC